VFRALRRTISAAQPRSCAVQPAGSWSRSSCFWAGEPLDSYQKILNYARTTRTQSGLTVTAYIDRRNYPCGIKPIPEQIASLRLHCHEMLPLGHYTIQALNVKLFLA
jgi:hypothetical protein